MAKDLKWAIEEVMKKSKNSLGAIGMGDVDDEDPNKFKFHPVSSHKLVFDSPAISLCGGTQLHTS